MPSNKTPFYVGQRICSFTLVKNLENCETFDPRKFNKWECLCDCGESADIQEHRLLNERPLFCREEKPAAQLVLEAAVARCIADYLKEYAETTLTTMHPVVLALIKLSDYQEERIYKARRMADGINTQLIQATFHEDMGR